MRKISALILLAMIACQTASVCLAAQEEASEARPNILYIFTDDQSIRSVGCYPEAHPWVETPNINRLANEGVRFTHCYTGTWCMASRATALTGRLPHGIRSMRMAGDYPASTYDPQQCPFWPSVFRKAGYTTGMIGKWHTGSDTGHGRDWDYSAVWDHTQPKIFGSYYKDQKISFNGAKPVAVGGYSTDNYTRYAVDFINRQTAEGKEPWYLWLCYDAPHTPYLPAERHADNYKQTPPVPVPKDIFPPRPEKPTYMKNYGVWKKDAQGKPIGLDAAVRKYNRAISAIDEGIGQVIETLRKTGRLDNTLIVFTSDQGFAWGQHGFKWKYAPYDANLRAPLIVRWPGRVARGEVCRHAVGGQDLIPTFFAAAKIDLPWKMHGHDLSPLLKRPDADWSHPLLMENTKYYYGDDTAGARLPDWNGVPCWVSLRDGKYKYIRMLIEDEIEELYDLEADPEELTNLALDPRYRKLLTDCRNRLLKELRRTDAPMSDHLPPVKHSH